MILYLVAWCCFSWGFIVGDAIRSDDTGVAPAAKAFVILIFPLLFPIGLVVKTLRWAFTSERSK